MWKPDESDWTRARFCRNGAENVESGSGVSHADDDECDDEGTGEPVWVLEKEEDKQASVEGKSGSSAFSSQSNPTSSPSLIAVHIISRCALWSMSATLSSS